MPSLVSKKTKSGTSWYIIENHTIDGKLSREYLKTLGVMTKTAAKNELARYQVGQGGNGKKTLLKHVVDLFFEAYQKQVGVDISQGTYNLALAHREHINSYFGIISIGTLESSDIEGFKQYLVLEKKHANRNVNLNLVTLRKILNFALDREYIRGIPKIKPLPETKHLQPIKYLTEAEAKTLLENANDNQRFFIQVMLLTGMRPNEFLKLLWEDVNLCERYIEIRSDNPKKLGRQLPINDNLLEILTAAELNKTGATVCPYGDKRSALNEMKRLGRKCGIEMDQYILRKTFCTWLANKKPAEIVAKLAGHSDIKTSLKYYITHRKETLREAVESVSIPAF